MQSDSLMCGVPTCTLSPPRCGGPDRSSLITPALGWKTETEPGVPRWGRSIVREVEFGQRFLAVVARRLPRDAEWVLVGLEIVRPGADALQAQIDCASGPPTTEIQAMPMSLVPGRWGPAQCPTPRPLVGRCSRQPPGTD